MNMLTSSLLLLAATANLVLLGMVLRRAGKRSDDSQDTVRTELRSGRDEARTSAKELREDVSSRIQDMDDALRATLTGHGQLQQNHHSGMGTQMRELAEANRLASDGLRSTIDCRIKDLQDSNDKKLAEIRTQTAEALKAGGDSVSTMLGQISQIQQTQLSELTGRVKVLSDSNQTTLERIRATLDARIQELQDGNDKKLGDIRVEISR